MEHHILNSPPLPGAYRRELYKLNPSGHYYKEPNRLTFGKLPEWLKVETTQTTAPKANGAATIIHGPQRGGKYTFYTGLRETGLINWQYGNDYEFRKGQKTNSLCLFRFGGNDIILIVYYFTGWYHHDRGKLESLIPSIISNILKNESEV